MKIDFPLLKREESTTALLADTCAFSSTFAGPSFVLSEQLMMRIKENNAAAILSWEDASILLALNGLNNFAQRGKHLRRHGIYLPQLHLLSVDD
ncbi:MAG: hypothetical protein EON98_10530 [Chitinophagaceae bacterium]|nr:MAG: hypothetical protein EON98_10530 [Chitinophagaceae bacterium]